MESMVATRNSGLSPRQLAVLQFAYAGYTPKYAARALGTSIQNIWKARQHAREKLGAGSMEAAYALAIQRGYSLDLPPLDGAPLSPRGDAERREEWVREWTRGHEFMEHWRGIQWHEAPLPDEVHDCRGQTRGVVYMRTLGAMPFVRCPCGAQRIDGVWDGVNSRRALAAVRQSRGSE